MKFQEIDPRITDTNLSDEEAREWNAIYASYRAKSVLTARVVGVDSIGLKNVSLPITGKSAINCLVLLDYRVKILIPETEVWYNENTSRPEHVLKSMIGSTLDYVIMSIDRENNVCLASRRMASAIRRKAFARSMQPDSKVTVQIMAVGRGHLLASCGGYDFTLSQRDLSYGMIPDLRARFHPGETYSAILKNHNVEKDTLTVSVKEAEPHPFIGAQDRHPIGSRRASTITGKYKGGVFCELEKDLVCLCLYSPYNTDEDFKIGDQVIIVITKYNNERKQVYGKILSKW